MRPELAELDAHRLDNDWTWAQLAAAMATREIQMSPRTLHYLIKGPAERPFDRTLHKVREYLKHVRRQRARRAKARPVTSASA